MNKSKSALPLTAPPGEGGPTAPPHAGVPEHASGALDKLTALYDSLKDASALPVLSPAGDDMDSDSGEDPVARRASVGSSALGRLKEERSRTEAQRIADDFIAVATPSPELSAMRSPTPLGLGSGGGASSENSASSLPPVALDRAASPMQDRGRPRTLSSGLGGLRHSAMRRSMEFTKSPVGSGRGEDRAAAAGDEAMDASSDDLQINVTDEPRTRPSGKRVQKAQSFMGNEKERQMTNLREQIAVLELKLTDARNENDLLQFKMKKTNKTLAESRKRVETLETEMDSYKQRADHFEAKNKELEEKFAKLKMDAQTKMHKEMEVLLRVSRDGVHCKHCEGYATAVHSCPCKRIGAVGLKGEMVASILDAQTEAAPPEHQSFHGSSSLLQSLGGGSLL